MIEKNTQKETNPSKRYINLYGEPLHTSPIKKLTSGADFEAASAAIITSVIAKEPIHGVMAFMMLSLDKRVRDSKLLEKYFGTNFDDLCIDKTPDHNTPPSKPSHILAAQLAKNDNKNAVKKHLKLWIPLASILLPTVAAGSPEKLLGLCAFLLVVAGIPTARQLSSAHRFNKVAEGEWVITDQPPPEPVKEPLSDKLKNAFGVLLPAPKSQKIPVKIEPMRPMRKESHPQFLTASRGGAPPMEHSL